MRLPEVHRKEGIGRPRCVPQSMAAILHGTVYKKAYWGGKQGVMFKTYRTPRNIDGVATRVYRRSWGDNNFKVAG